MLEDMTLPRKPALVWAKAASSSLAQGMRREKLLTCIALFLIVLVVPLSLCAVFDWPQDTSPPVPNTGPAKTMPASPAILWGTLCGKSGCSSAAMLEGNIPKNITAITFALQQRPAVKTLCLRSTGGNSIGGTSLSRWIFDNGYDTCVPRVERHQAVCASACTKVFASGRQRTMDRNGAFALHGAAWPALVNELPDVLTGQPGSPKGECAVCQTVSIKLNQTFSLIANALTWPLTPNTDPMNRLFLESVLIPAHTLRLLTPVELQDWKVTTISADVDLIWIGSP